MIEVFLTISLLLVTIVLSTYIASLLKVSFGRFIILFGWHTAFCAVYYAFYAFGEADSFYYFSVSQFGDTSIGVGTVFILWLTEILIQNLHFNYIDTFIIFNFIGFIGILLLDKIVKDLTKKSGSEEKIFSLIPFLPGLSFWTAALGKDGIAVTASIFAIFASLEIENRKRFLVIGIFLMFLVRPHIALIMTIAAGIGLFFGGKLSFQMRIILAAIGAIFLASTIGFVLSYGGLENIESLADIGSAVEKRQGYNLEGGGGVDIANMSVPEQLFTYFFRPLFFDAPGAAGFAASLEDVILLIFVLQSIRKLFVELKRNRSFFVMYNTIYFLLGGLLLAVTTANLGIATRQKWMLLPSLLVLCTYVLLPRVTRQPLRPRISAVTNFSTENKVETKPT